MKSIPLSANSYGWATRRTTESGGCSRVGLEAILRQGWLKAKLRVPVTPARPVRLAAWVARVGRSCPLSRAPWAHLERLPARFARFGPNRAGRQTPLQENQSIE